MPLGLKLPPKLQAKHEAKAMRKFEAAQAGERPKGLLGMFSRGPMPSKVMDMASQARANMPAAGGMRGRPMVEDIMVAQEAPAGAPMMRKGGKVKKMAKGGSVSSASKRGDGCATKGKTKGKFV